jgi:hypothetical protein
MTKTRKTKYLTYIEDTPKYHYLIKDMAKKSGENAIIKSRSKDVAVTFLEGSSIVRESSNGTIEVIKEVGTTHRKVKIGSKTTIYKGKKD